MWKSVQEKKVEIKDGSKIKNRMVEDIRSSIKRSNENISRERDNITRFEVELNEINKVNFEEELKPYETQGDKIVKVLFAPKEKA